MSPRPRSIADAEILAGAGRVMGRLGPARLTLAEVAGEVGLAPATLIQRFGSKRGLLLAFAAAASASATRPFEEARAEHSSPLAALWKALLSMTEGIRTPESLANHLAFLQVDLSDPEFHEHAGAHARAVRAEIASLLRHAVTAGELRACDPVRLGSALHAAFQGALLNWAILGDGELEEWIRGELTTVLTPWLAGSWHGTLGDRPGR